MISKLSFCRHAQIFFIPFLEMVLAYKLLGLSLGQESMNLPKENYSVFNSSVQFHLESKTKACSELFLKSLRVVNSLVKNN